MPVLHGSERKADGDKPCGEGVVISPLLGSFQSIRQNKYGRRGRRPSCMRLCTLKKLRGKKERNRQGFKVRVKTLF